MRISHTVYPPKSREKVIGETHHFSDDPLKDKVIRNIIRCRYREQYINSIIFANMAGFKDDELVQEWIWWRQLLHFDDETPF